MKNREYRMLIAGALLLALTCLLYTSRRVDLSTIQRSIMSSLGMELQAFRRQRRFGNGIKQGQLL